MEPAALQLASELPAPPEWELPEVAIDDFMRVEGDADEADADADANPPQDNNPPQDDNPRALKTSRQATPSPFPTHDVTIARAWMRQTLTRAPDSERTAMRRYIALVDPLGEHQATSSIAVGEEEAGDAGAAEPPSTTSHTTTAPRKQKLLTDYMLPKDALSGGGDASPGGADASPGAAYASPRSAMPFTSQYFDSDYITLEDSARRSYPCPLLCVRGLWCERGLPTMRQDTGELMFLQRRHVDWIWRHGLSLKEKMLIYRYRMQLRTGVQSANRWPLYGISMETAHFHQSPWGQVQAYVGGTHKQTSSSELDVDWKSVDATWNAMDVSHKTSFLMIGARIARGTADDQLNWCRPGSFLLRHIQLIQTWAPEETRNAVLGHPYMRRFLGARALWFLWCTGNVGLRRALLRSGGPVHPGIHLLRMWWANVRRVQAPFGKAAAPRGCVAQFSGDSGKSAPADYTEADEREMTVVAPSFRSFLAHRSVPYPRIVIPHISCPRQSTVDKSDDEKGATRGVGINKHGETMLYVSKSFPQGDAKLTIDGEELFATWDRLILAAKHHASGSGRDMDALWERCMRNRAVFSVWHCIGQNANAMQQTVGVGVGRERKWTTYFDYPFRQAQRYFNVSLNMLMTDLHLRLLHIRHCAVRGGDSIRTNRAHYYTHPGAPLVMHGGGGTNVTEKFSIARSGDPTAATYIATEPAASLTLQQSEFRQCTLREDQPDLPTSVSLTLQPIDGTGGGDRYNQMPMLVITVYSHLNESPERGVFPRPHHDSQVLNVTAYYVDPDTGLIHALGRGLGHAVRHGVLANVVSGYSAESGNYVLPTPIASLWLPDTWSNLVRGFAQVPAFFWPRISVLKAASAEASATTTTTSLITTTSTTPPTTATPLAGAHHFYTDPPLVRSDHWESMRVLAPSCALTASLKLVGSVDNYRSPYRTYFSREATTATWKRLWLGAMPPEVKPPQEDH